MNLEKYSESTENSLEKFHTWYVKNSILNENNPNASTNLYINRTQFIFSLRGTQLWMNIKPSIFLTTENSYFSINIYSTFSFHPHIFSQDYNLSEESCSYMLLGIKKKMKDGDGNLKLKFQIKYYQNKHTFPIFIKKMLNLCKEQNIKETITIKNEGIYSFQIGINETVLTYHSKIFKIMLSHDSKEKKDRTISIPDIKNKDIMKSLFVFMNFGFLNKKTKINTLQSLLSISFKYKMYYLSIGIQELLSKIISKVNAVSLLSLCDNLLKNSEEGENITINEDFRNNLVNFIKTNMIINGNEDDMIEVLNYFPNFVLEM